MARFRTPEFVIFILNRLKHAGFQAYVVGGAVRDACLKRPITDWDVTTSAPPEEIKKIFRDISLFALKHDTVTLVNSGHHFEVTTFRGGKNHLLEDLGRRDFTINAMAYDPDKGEILDPYEGKADIAKKLVRAVGDPEARFREDPLRLLRAVRLATEIGFRIEEKTLQAIIIMAPFLSSVSSERIREELMKVLMVPRPSRCFNLMIRTGIINSVLPELLEGYRRRQNVCHRYTIFRHIMETVDRVKPVPLLRLTGLLHDIAKPRVRKKIDGTWRFHGHEEASAVLAMDIMGRLRFGKEMIEKVTNLVRHHMIVYDSGWSDGAVRRLIRRVGLEQIMALIAFRRADIQAHGLNNEKLDLLRELEARVKTHIAGQVAVKTQDLAIDGHKIMEVLGISPGPEVGRVLDNLMEKIIDYPELNNEGALLGLVEQMKGA